MITGTVRTDYHKVLQEWNVTVLQSLKAPIAFYILFNHIRRLANRRSSQSYGDEELVSSPTAIHVHVGLYVSPGVGGSRSPRYWDGGWEVFMKYYYILQCTGIWDEDTVQSGDCLEIDRFAYSTLFKTSGSKTLNYSGTLCSPEVLVDCLNCSGKGPDLCGVRRYLVVQTQSQEIPHNADSTIILCFESLPTRADATLFASIIRGQNHALRTLCVNIQMVTCGHIHTILPSAKETIVTFSHVWRSRMCANQVRSIPGHTTCQILLL